MSVDPTLVVHRRHDLLRKIASVEDELEAWTALSQPGQRLEKHKTQIERMARQLSATAQKVKSEVAEAEKQGKLFECAPDLEQAAVGLHRIWQFYRGKLTLRLVDWFAEPLQVADEIAWDCYVRARALAAAANAAGSVVPAAATTTTTAAVLTGAAAVTPVPMEPPLVFFNGGTSPFTQPRDAPYEAESVPLEPGMQRIDLRRILRRLPFPVIGIPWYQGRHLCDLMVLGHEVGHGVDNDFALSVDIAKHIEHAVPAERAAAWTSWAGELFADAYGVLAGGPAFVSSLLDFVLVDPSAARDKMLYAPDWGDYPPAALRARFNAALLTHRGFAPEGDKYLGPWLAACAGHALRAYDRDLPAVAAALLDGGYGGLGGRPLPAALSFDPDAYAAAQEAAAYACEGRTPPARDMRVLAAAARLAYLTDPDVYGGTPADRLRKAMRDALPGGVRARLDTGRDAGERRAVDVADRDAADWLFGALTGRA